MVGKRQDVEDGVLFYFVLKGDLSYVIVFLGSEDP